jgi:hypothetical protein
MVTIIDSGPDMQLGAGQIMVGPAAVPVGIHPAIVPIRPRRGSVPTHTVFGPPSVSGPMKRISVSAGRRIRLI